MLMHSAEHLEAITGLSKGQQMDAKREVEKNKQLRKEQVYRNYLTQEEGFLHAPYDPEMEFYSAIRQGDEAKVEKLFAESEPLHEKKGLGRLSADPLRNMKYHFTITAAIVARTCIEGGMDLAAAYGLSDFYILKMDGENDIGNISQLHQMMCLDYAKRMKLLSQRRIHAKPVVKSITYIRENLHTKITVEDLAAAAGCSASYLAHLFRQETGYSVQRYIQMQKIETAKNMLRYSEFSISEIAATLSFPSQSYFTEVFRRNTGVSPGKYRDDPECLPDNTGDNLKGSSRNIDDNQNHPPGNIDVKNINKENSI